MTYRQLARSVLFWMEEDKIIAWVNIDGKTVLTFKEIER